MFHYVPRPKPVGVSKYRKSPSYPNGAPAMPLLVLVPANSPTVTMPLITLPQFLDVPPLGHCGSTVKVTAIVPL